MHILNRGFGSRRKSSSKRPRDLHIRKVSFSGSSLSSGCSLSSSASSASSTFSSVATPVASTPTAFRPEIDPLHLNPAFHAPPRLFERPYKNLLPANDCSDLEDQDEDQLTAKALEQEPEDYFFTSLSPPPAPRAPSPEPFSRWSESTVATLDFEVSQDSDDATSDSEDDEDVLQMRRLSRRSSHRAAALQTLSLNLAYMQPKRPPMKSVDSVENYMRRGGWKRRGIVFRAEDAEDMENVTREPGERASF